MKMVTNSSMEKRLFLGNLPHETTVNDLQKLLRNYNVSNIEIKRKTFLDQDSVFAYVNVPEAQVHRCLQKYQSRKWNGCVLKVEVAKESFLDRLKKERSQQKKNVNTSTGNTDLKSLEKYNNCSSKNKKILFTLDDDEDISHNDNLQINSHLDDNVNHREIKRKLSKEITKTEMDLNGDNKNETASKRNVPMFRGITAYEAVAEEPVPDSTKKLEYFNDVWKNEKSIKASIEPSTLIKWKNFLNIAENNEITSNENKIVEQSKFSAESKRKNALEEKWNAIKKKKSVIRKSFKTYDTKNKNIRFSDVTNEENIKINTKDKKIALFDENSSDDDFEVSFEVREELEGKNGMKLLKLKSKLLNDERFKIDERFLDDDATQNTNELEGSTSKSDGLNNILQNRSMIRYDPTKPEHQVLEKNATAKSPKIKKMKMKKKPKKHKPSGEETKKVEVQKHKVSKEKHYSIADTLKDAFKKDDCKPKFKLSSLFDEKLKKTISTDCDSNKSIPLKKMRKVINPLENLSESDDDVDNSSIDEAPLDVPLTVPSEKVLGTCGVWGETFFFKESDSRLKESVNFFNASKISSDKDFANQRSKLRSIIRKKIQTTKRENREFKYKLGGINKKKFIMRLKKAHS